MISRAFRAFKSWHQYRAESLGLSLSEYQALRAEKVEGEFVQWKRQVAVNNRVHFLLDHCTAEEQSVFLQEFDVFELARFLLENINYLSVEEMRLLSGLHVRFHLFPGVNTLFGLPSTIKQALIKDDPELDELQKLRKSLKETLKQKMKEIEWRRIDADLSAVSKEVQLKG